MTPPTYNVVIIGGSRGLGKALVETWLEKRADAHIYATARNTANASSLQQLVARYPGRLTLLDLEMTDKASRDSFVERLPEAIESLWIVAGISQGMAPIEKAAAEDLRHTFEVNAISPHLLMQALAPRLTRSTATRRTVVLYSSAVASKAGFMKAKSQVLTFFRFPRHIHAVYATSKAAMNMLALFWGDFFRLYNIPVIAVHPGIVITDINRHRVPAESLEHLEDFAYVTEPILSARALYHLAEKATIDSANRGMLSWNGEDWPW